MFQHKNIVGTDKLNKSTITSQSGRETEKPSTKWIYHLFHGVHILKLRIDDQVHNMALNMNDLLRRIVIYFGKFACNIYDVKGIN